MGLNVHLEAYSVKQELVRQANKNYIQNDQKKMQDMI